jgi:hypothetical protein
MTVPDDVVTVTVNLTRPAHQALNRSVETTGHTRTDTINRAIRLYATMCAAALTPGRHEIVMPNTGRTPLLIHVEQATP